MALRTTILMRTKFSHSVNDEDQFVPEFLFNIFARHAPILHGIVEKTGGNGGSVHTVFGKYLCGRRRMGEIGLARVPGLALMRLLGELIRLLDERNIFGRRLLHLGNDFLDGRHPNTIHLRINYDYFKYSAASALVSVSGFAVSGR